MTTPKPLTEQQLAEIEARTNAATPGPWTVSEDYSDVITPDGGQLASYWNPTSETRNGEFIAAARTDVPALLAEVRRLRARSLTENEYSAAWHAVEGAAGEEGADPGTVLHAVLDRLGITVPAAGAQPDTATP
ncbi:hypothetical protein [Streptomyces sp. LN704]|uniref:hypothetical protein n=1 Tax=Streptomyces sp. LN704 TaxID=3112982 RepID=UPI003717AEBD